MDHSGHGIKPDGHGAPHDHAHHQSHVGLARDFDTSTEAIPMATANNNHPHMDHSVSSDVEGHSELHSMGSMTFHFGTDEKVLFSWWSIEGAGTMVASFFGIFLLAMLYEGLKFYRDRLLCRTYAPLPYRVVECGHRSVVNTDNGNCASGHIRQEGCVDKPVTEDDMLVIQHKMFSWSHSWQTFLHALQVTLSYCLMLVFMTYNVWLCLAVVLGATFGYFIFGCRKSYVVDVTEHCH